MTFRDFISSRYNVTDRIRARVVNPIEAVKEADFLPYDDIIVYDGVLQKIVYLDKDTPFPVTELLSYTRADVDKMDDCPLKDVYNIYMENIDETDMDIQSIMQAARIFMKNKQNKMEEKLKCIQ